MIAPSRLAVIGAFLITGVLPPPALAAKYEIDWLLGHPTLDYFEEAAMSFKKAVEEGSGGEIKINVVLHASDAPSRGPGESPEIAARVARGEAEMGHSFVDVAGGVDGRLLAFKAPYLFRGYRHLEGVFEGPLGSELLEGLRAHGMVGLSFTYSGGANGIATLDREIRAPEDLRGLRVGVFGDAVDRGWLESLGATPVAIGHDEPAIRRLLGEGRLDAVVITWRNFEKAALAPDFKFFNVAGWNYLVSVTYINEKFFSGLPAEHRELLARASREAGRIERAKTIELNENAKSVMLGKGVRAVHLTERGKARFSRALRPAYERAIAPAVGPELLERIRKTRDSAEHPSVPPEFAKR